MLADNVLDCDSLSIMSVFTDRSQPCTPKVTLNHTFINEEDRSFLKDRV